MFGSQYFGQTAFAGAELVFSNAKPIVVVTKTGWPFPADDLEVPDARVIPRFNRVAEHARAIQADDEEIMEIVNAWLRTR